ncbi:MAG: copper resistance protein NlpE [Methylococcales bacterium]|nr:copper resistance protein NlpE [Methylococcales bacterium]
MQILRQQFKQSLTLFLFIATFLGYSNVFAETTHNAQSSLWSGVYQGFVPCDDCQGVKTSLALNKNNSYILISQYVGKSPKEIVEKGKFTLNDASDTVILTPRNSTQVRQYFIGEESLVQLDADGNRVTGKTADRYILRKMGISEPQATSPSHH